MSGGEIVVLPAMLLVVPLAAVAGAWMAAALAIRAAAAGTQAAGRALEHLGDEMLRVADAQDDAVMRTRLWGIAAGAVAGTNNDLLLMTARAERVGIQVVLPRRIDLTGCRLADTRALVAEARQALESARADIASAEASRAQRTLLAKLTIPVGELPTAAEVLARHQEMLTLRRAPAGVMEPVPSRPDEERRVRSEIHEILLRLDPDALAGDREQVLAASARTERKKGNAAASCTFLDALRRMVDDEINPRAGRRREAAGLLAGLEHPVIGGMIGELPSPRPPFLRSIDRLQAVVRGDADLTDADRNDACVALAWAQRELDRRRLLEGITEAFAGLGYTVSTGMQVHHSTSLSVTRPSWLGEHTADVWIDQAGNVQSHLVQTVPDAAGEATRCTELNVSLQQVGDQLLRSGMEASVNVPQEQLHALKRYGPGAEVPNRHDEAGPKVRVADDARNNR